MPLVQVEVNNHPCPNPNGDVANIDTLIHEKFMLYQQQNKGKQNNVQVHRIEQFRRVVHYLSNNSEMYPCVYWMRSRLPY